MRGFLLTLAASLFVLPAISQAQVTRFLVVGDSWAEEQWTDGSHQQVFNTNGLAAVAVSGELTTTSGSTAADWVMAVELERIGNALAQYPHIDTVQLTIGGNDFLDAWNTGYSEAQFDELIGWISQDVEFVATYILNQRPDIEIIISLYDYPNFEDTRDGFIWLGLCSGLWSDLGQPTPLELNTAAVEVIDAVELLADSDPRISHVRHLGQAQNEYGIPGFPPGTLAPPGDINLPSPLDAMRTRFPGGGHDCFHFNGETYEVLIENLLVGYVDERFEPGLSLQFDTLQVGYNGQPQAVPVTTGPPGQGLIISYDGSLDEPVDVGNYAVVVTSPGWRENLQGVFEIIPGVQLIDFPQPAPVLVTETEVVLSATASSGLPVAYDLISGPATLAGNILTLNGTTGTIVVQATQTGDGNWMAAEPVQRNIEVVEMLDELFDDRFELML